MRTETEAERIHELALGLLRRRGIAERQASYDDLAGAYEVVAEARERGAETLAEVLGYAAVGGHAPDETTLRVLSRFATSGRFIADCSIEEQELLAEAIRVEQEKDAAAILAESHPGGVQMIHGEPYCSKCDYALSSGLCKCQT